MKKSEEEMKRTHNEYGGFLPLELNEGEEYFQYDESQMRRFNCAKAAVNYVIESVFPKIIYAPYYLCPNVCKEIEHHDSEIRYYHIDEDLTPCDLPDKEDTCIYLVNYFGIMDAAIMQCAKRFEKAMVIIDNSHSFYCKPFIANRIYNIYSCKKFFGVPDGAYLVAANLEGKELEATYSSEHAQYLLECHEHGTNYCYNKKKEVDSLIAEKYGGMSILAKRILEAIDYEAVREKRKRNFLQFERAFSAINRFKCEENSVPYIYPLNVGRNIKRRLIEEKIYVPTLWGHMLEEEYKGTFEYSISDETIFLPLDQRYGEEDVGYIINCVKDILAKNNVD